MSSNDKLPLPHAARLILLMALAGWGCIGLVVWGVVALAGWLRG
jgi:hypothetical protein